MNNSITLTVAACFLSMVSHCFADNSIPKIPSMQLLQGVQLTAEQQVALKAVFKEKKEVLKAKERAFKDTSLEVKRMLLVIDAQDEALKGVIENERAALQDLAMERISLLKELASKLTENQRAAFQAILTSTAGEPVKSTPAA